MLSSVLPWNDTILTDYLFILRLLHSPPCLPPSSLSPLSCSLPLSLPPSFPPLSCSLPPSLPSYLPTSPLSLTPYLPPSLPPPLSLAPCLPPSLPPSLPPCLPLSLPPFLSLSVYINHRPVFGLSPVDLVTAFQTLGTRDEAQGWTMGREELVAMLQENGETMYPILI